MSSDNVSRVDNQQASEKISDEYFAGFVDGEGCFYVGFSKRTDLPIGWQIITEFHLSQNPGGKNILDAFKNRLGCGYLKPNHAVNPKDRTWVLIVKDRKDIEERLIPFFEKHILHSQKMHDFTIFSSVINSIRNKEHLTREGFNKIVDLVFNTTRITKKRYSKEILKSF